MSNDYSITGIQSHLRLLSLAILAKGWCNPSVECSVSTPNIDIMLQCIKGKFIIKQGFRSKYERSNTSSCYEIINGTDFDEVLSQAWAAINDRLDRHPDQTIGPWFDMQVYDEANGQTPGQTPGQTS